MSRSPSAEADDAARSNATEAPRKHTHASHDAATHTTAAASGSESTAANSKPAAAVTAGPESAAALSAPSSSRPLSEPASTSSSAASAGARTAAAADTSATAAAASLEVPAPAPTAAAAAELSPCSRSPAVPTVTIKLHAAGHTRRFRLPSDCSFAALRAEVAELCKLREGDFHITCKVDDDDRVMSGDACVALAFAPALADAHAAATPGGPAVGRPVRLAVEMIARVPAANSRQSMTRRKPSLPSAAAGSASAASCVSESAGSSAIALAQAAISMSAAPAPLPLNAAAASASSVAASAVAVPEVSACLSAIVGAIDEVAENREERAAARVRSLLSHPHATWTLESVQQQMRDSGDDDDALLLSLVTPAMLSQQMDHIVAARAMDAALCASVAFNPTPLPPLPPQPIEPAEPAASASASSSSSRVSSSSTAPRKWACELCSFHNVAALKSCQMCAWERSVQAQAAMLSPSAPSLDSRPHTPLAAQTPVLSADAPPFEPIFRVRAPVGESKAAEANTVVSPAIVCLEPAVAPSEPSPPSAAASPVAAPESLVPAPIVVAVDAPELIRPLSPAIALPAASDLAPSSGASSASASVSSSVASLASPISSTSSTLPASPSTLELQQLREQLARMSDQMAQLLATQSSVSAGGSPSASLSASSFGAPTNAAAPPSLAASAAAPASPADSLVAAQLAALLDLQHARFAEMEKTQAALQAKVLEMERQKLNRKRSGSVKTFAGAGGAAIAKHRQRSLSGVRSAKPGAQWGSGSLSSSQQSSPLSTSVPASPLLSSVHSSPDAAPQVVAAALPTLDLQPALSASRSSASATPQLSSHASPAILGSDLDLSQYVKLSCLSELDLAAVTESPAASQLVPATDEQTERAALPPRAPILSTIPSCSELEAAAAEESNVAACAPAPKASPAASPASVASPAPAASPSVSALSAIPESSSISPDAASVSSSSLTALPSAIAAASSTLTTASSASPSSVSSDLSSSVEFRDDVRFPSVPDVRDREPKLDELAHMGFTNRIFASMLLDMHAGDMASTIADLKQFYGAQH